MIFLMKAFKLLYFVIRNRCEGLKRVGIEQVDTSVYQSWFTVMCGTAKWPCVI